MADDLAKPIPMLLSRDVAYRHISYVLEQGFKFHAQLWSDDPKVRAKNEKYMEDHPREFKARERSFAMFLSHYGPRQPQQLKEDKPPIDIDALDEMNLSDEELKKIAGIKEK